MSPSRECFRRSTKIAWLFIASPLVNSVLRTALAISNNCAKRHGGGGARLCPLIERSNDLHCRREFLCFLRDRPAWRLTAVAAWRERGCQSSSARATRVSGRIPGGIPPDTTAAARAQRFPPLLASPARYLTAN